MNILTSLKTLSPFVNRGVQILKAKSPVIFTVTGIISGITASVIAVKRTPLCEKVKEDFEESVDKANKALEVGEIYDENNKLVKYTNAEFKHDLRIFYSKKYIEYAKIFGLPVIIGAGSITSILIGHGILMKRNAALTATVASVSEAFRRYRENVRNQYGDEIDYNMRNGIICDKVKVKEKDPETGETKISTKVVKRRRQDCPSGMSDYARCYEAGCRNWIRDSSTNRLTLMSFEAFANQKLRQNGYLYLNDVYEMLGIDQTLAGHSMGWIYMKNGDNPHGDNFIDFGYKRSPDFMCGSEMSVWLDFNVDDLPITDRITWRIK